MSAARTRRATSTCWTIEWRGAPRRRRNYWKNSMGRGSARSIRSMVTRRIDASLDPIELFGLFEGLLASRGIIVCIGLLRPRECRVGVGIRHPLGVLQGFRRRLVMKLGADRLRRGRPGLRPRGRIADLLFELRDLRGAWAAMRGAGAGDQRHATGEDEKAAGAALPGDVMRENRPVEKAASVLGSAGHADPTRGRSYGSNFRIAVGLLSRIGAREAFS